MDQNQTHLSEGEIRAYLDHSLPTSEQMRTADHLESCSHCQERQAELHLRAQHTGDHLSALNPKPGRLPNSYAGMLDAGNARLRLQRRLDQPFKEQETMFNQLFSRRFRPALSAFAVITVMVAALLAFPSVRAAASDFLGLFRVKQITVVQVNPANLPEQLGSSSGLEAMFSNDVKVEEGGQPQTAADAAQASALAGMTVRLPSNLSAPELTVRPGSKATYNVNVQHIQALLNEINRQDIQVPTGVDGAQVVVEVPNSVLATWGACKRDAAAARAAGEDPDMPGSGLLGCTTLIQMPSPTVTAPPGLDISKIGEAFLQVMGMSQADAAHFSEQIDWTTTLVIPIPRYGTSYRDVNVDGVPGTLIERQADNGANQYMLMWVKDGNVYALAGTGSMRTALETANSLQ